MDKQATATASIDEELKKACARLADAWQRFAATVVNNIAELCEAATPPRPHDKVDITEEDKLSPVPSRTVIGVDLARGRDTSKTCIVTQKVDGIASHHIPVHNVGDVVKFSNLPLDNEDDVGKMRVSHVFWDLSTGKFLYTVEGRISIWEEHELEACANEEC